ncbi:MAG: hypothetical protein WCF95_00630 [bacterium]
MISGITGGNFTGAQALRALDAFKMDENIVKGVQKQIEEAAPEQVAIQEDVNLSLRNDMSMQKASEIKQYGQMFDINISNSDINYALSYGRSVIVDYKA